MEKRISTLRRLILVVALTALAGCADTPEDLVKSAKEFLAKGDPKSAVVQLRNAAQKKPDLAEARFLLGAALFDTGDFPSAEKELRKAIELDYPAEQVVPTLVRVMVAAGEYKAVIAEFGSASIASPQATAELKSALGHAYFATGNAAAGKAAFEAALAAQPDYAPASLGLARLKAASGDLPGAVALIDAALAKTPKFAEGWNFKGDLAMAQSQRDDAFVAYQKAVEANPDFIPPRASLVMLLVHQGKPEEAAAQLEAIKKIAPAHPRTLYMQAALAYHRKDYAAARDVLQQQLRAAPDDLQGLLLSGAVDYELRSYATAEKSLARVLSAVPNYSLARRLITRTYLRSGQPAKALAALKPVLGDTAQDPRLLALAGEVYLANGQPEEAAKYFTKVVTVDPKGSGGRLGLAVSHLATGERDMALQELETAAAEGSGPQADLLLIRMALLRGEFDKGLAAIDALERKQPNAPLARYLRGLALLGKRDSAGARKSFEQALGVDAAYAPAAAALARMDLADKKPEDAAKRYQAVLAKDPKNTAALLGLAELRALSGGTPDEVAALIEKAIAADPTAVLPRTALITYRLRTNDARKAVAAGQDAVAALPDQAEIVQALAAAQLAAGETGQALSTYNRLIQLQPNSPFPLVLMAAAQVAAKDNAAALQSLRKALAVKPDMLDAQTNIVLLEAAAGRITQAVAMAREVQKQRPTEAVGYVLEGNVHAQKEAWKEAASAYRAGLKQTGAVLLAMKLHEALDRAGQAAEADKVASSWVKEKPSDVTFTVYLAERAVARNDLATAVRHYRKSLEIQPDNAGLLNNLAWTAGRLKDPRAIEYAEKSNKLAPNQPDTLNTLGTLLVEKGDTARGIELLRKASQLAPTSASKRLDLAKALIGTGQKDAAKKELEELAKLAGKNLQQDAEVEQLMKGI